MVLPSVRDEWIRPNFETFGQCCSNKDADPASNDLSSEIAVSRTINDIGVQHCLRGLDASNGFQPLDGHAEMGVGPPLALEEKTSDITAACAARFAGVTAWV